MKFFPSRRNRVLEEGSSEDTLYRGGSPKPVQARTPAEPNPKEQETSPADSSSAASAESVENLGPFSEGESPEGSEFLDLGALRIPLIAGLQMFPVQDEHGNILAVEIVTGTGQMQLSAFAMQRSGGLWDQVREELSEQLKSQEYQIFPLPGPFGEALLARPIPGGKSAHEGALPLLLWGVEGKRWLLRVIVRGLAAEDEATRRPLLEVLHRLEVVRGEEARVPGELLPIILPEQVRQQLEAGEQ